MRLPPETNAPVIKSKLYFITVVVMSNQVTNKAIWKLPPLMCFRMLSGRQLPQIWYFFRGRFSDLRAPDKRSLA